MRHPESKLQIACFQWFRYQHRSIARLLFSVPNGGFRSATEAKILRAEGATSGVSDCVLLVPRGSFASLCIEFKADKGKQTDLQKSWQELAEKNGNKYVVCRSFDEFREAVQMYLCQKS